MTMHRTGSESNGFGEAAALQPGQGWQEYEVVGDRGPDSRRWRVEAVGVSLGARARPGRECRRHGAASRLGRAIERVAHTDEGLGTPA